MYKIGAFYLWSEKPALNPFSHITRTTNRIRKKRDYDNTIVCLLDSYQISSISRLQSYRTVGRCCRGSNSQVDTWRVLDGHRLNGRGIA